MTWNRGAGLATTKDAIRKHLGDSSNPLRVAFERLAEERRGNPGVVAETPRESGRFAVVHPEDDGNRIPNNVRDSVDGTNDQTEVTKPKRDRSREPQAGNSVGYAVRRLKREASENPTSQAAQAYERLKAGQVSANAAMIQAGLRHKEISIPVDPKGAASRIVRSASTTADDPHKCRWSGRKREQDYFPVNSAS